MDVVATKAKPRQEQKVKTKILVGQCCCIVDSLWSLSLVSQHHPAIYWAKETLWEHSSLRQLCLQSKLLTIAEMTHVLQTSMFP